MSARLFVVLASLSASASAQVAPQLDPQNPRMQTTAWQPSQPVLLTVLPEIGTTVLLEAQDRIVSAITSDQGEWRITISPENNGFHLLPLNGQSDGTLEVMTQNRGYKFVLLAGEGLSSALVLRFAGDQAGLPSPQALPPGLPSRVWTYSLRGDRTVRPASLTDDGARTTIVFAPEQSLPAIFARGPTGDEEVVNGHMRDGVFVIDRVHEELVFRIDSDRATARRREKPEDEP